MTVTAKCTINYFGTSLNLMHIQCLAQNKCDVTTNCSVALPKWEDDSALLTSDKIQQRFNVFSINHGCRTLARDKWLALSQRRYGTESAACLWPQWEQLKKASCCGWRWVSGVISERRTAARAKVETCWEVWLRRRTELEVEKLENKGWDGAAGRCEKGRRKTREMSHYCSEGCLLLQFRRQNKKRWRQTSQPLKGAANARRATASSSS